MGGPYSNMTVVTIRGDYDGHAQREDHKRTETERGHLQGKERPLEDTNATDTLISDFQSPES